MDETTAPALTTFSFGPPEAEAGGLLTIDLGAVKANWQMLRRRVTPAECAAVVKGDAYGCGLEPVTALLYYAGCTTFFVADLAEAKRVRVLAPEATIYVLNGLAPNTGPVFAENYLHPVINSLAELAEWDAFVAGSEWRGGFALHVDTGMNRLGLTIEEAAALAPRVQSEHHGIKLLMSHLIASELPEHPLNDAQIRAFRDIRIMFRGVPASIANSAGLFLGPSALCDMVRPGVALYGANPIPGQLNPMQPVVSLQGRIVQVRNVPSGATVGYDATWKAPHASRIAVVAIGYADGFSRAASATNTKRGGEALVAGRRCPFVGRVSMDLLAIDVTGLSEREARRGDLVTLIGGELDIDAVAARLGTISYEVLAKLGRRYARIYRSAAG